MRPRNLSYGCFFSDLTRLAGGTSPASLPQSFWRKLAYDASKMLRYFACEIALQSCCAFGVADNRSYDAIDVGLAFADGDIDTALPNEAAASLYLAW